MGPTRQLAAIMFTNIDGYSSLMQQDESKAVELKERHFEVFKRVNENFHGKILPYFGPHSLSLFSSAVEAVQCAVEMQRSFREQPEVPVRIGIHLGDVIYSEEEVIGEGISIALKIESQAPVGGILISNKIYEEIKKQPEIETLFIESCCLDDTDEQIDVYAITNPGIVVPDHAQVERSQTQRNSGSTSGLLRFWREAKRRGMVRVVSVYAAAAYVILELMSIIEKPLNLPPWTMTVVIVLLSTLFVVISILSWIYDFTPEGIIKTPPLDNTEGSRRKNDKVAETESLKMNEKLNWFARHRVARRYLVPLMVVSILGIFYLLKDRLLENWERVNKVALEHTERAKVFINNRAASELIKQELDLALEADPEYAPALYTYAMIHSLEGDTLLAKRKLHLTVSFDPGYSRAWDLLAIFAFAQDSFDLATGYSIRAIETDPANSTAACNMAMRSEDRGLYSEAVEWYTKAIKMDSTFVIAYSAQGALYNKLDRPTEAILTLRKSLRISPASEYNYLVYKNLSEAYFRLNDYGQVLEYLENSKALNPDYPETEKCYARLYEAKGEIEKSVLHWRRYLALETDTSKLRDAQGHLDSIRLQKP